MSCAIRRVWYEVASVAAMHEIFSSRGSYTGEPLLPYYRNEVFSSLPRGHRVRPRPGCPRGSCLRVFPAGSAGVPCPYRRHFSSVRPVLGDANQTLDLWER